MMLVLLFSMSAGAVSCAQTPEKTESSAEQQSDEYMDLVNQAADDLSQNEWQKAEMLALDARKLNSSRPEAYEMLYESYYARQREPEADAVTEQAESSLSADDYQSYLEQVQSVRHAYQLVNSYQVLKDVGQMEMTPVFIGDNAWLIRQNGEYSIMDVDGEIVPGYTDKYSILVIGVKNPKAKFAYNEQDVRACQSPVYEFGDHMRQWPEPNRSRSNVCIVTGIIGPQPEYELNDQNEVVLTEDSLEGYQTFKTDPEPLTEPIYLRKAGQTAGDFYIYDPAKRLLLGPYQEDEQPAFALLVKKFNVRDQNVPDDQVYIFSWTQVLYSPFWSHDDSSGEERFTIYSADGTTSLEGFDEAAVVDSRNIGTKKNGVYHLYNQYLHERYVADFQAGSAMVQHRALVLKDGSWKLVEFGEKVPLKDAEKESLTQENLEEADGNPEEESDE